MLRLKFSSRLSLAIVAFFAIFLVSAVLFSAAFLNPASNPIETPLPTSTPSSNSNQNLSQSEYYGFGDFFSWDVSSYTGGWDALFPQMREMGTNTFRLAFLFEDCAEFGMTSAQGAFWDDAQVEALVAKAYSYGMTTVLDLHLIWCPGYLESQNWIDNWVNVAAKYRGDSRIAAFEIYNEPYAAVDSYTQYQLHARFAQCTRAIHAIDPDRKIVWFPTCIVWNGGVKDSISNPTYVHPQEFLEPNIILNMHHWNIGLDNPVETQKNALYGIEYMAQLKDKYNREVIIGETGGAIGEEGEVPNNYNAYEAQQAYVRTFAVEAPNYGVGVLFWEANWTWDTIYSEALHGVTFP